MKNSVVALINFMNASKGQTQSIILKEFIKTIIKENDVSESGSILLDNPTRGKLELFNEDFLLKEGMLEKGKPWSKEFDYFEGIAGLAYRTKEIQIINDVSKNSNYSNKNGEVPIVSIICTPIILSTNRFGRPFGVINFHNSNSTKQFSEDDINIIKAYCGALTWILDSAQKDFDIGKSKRVFIVHGRDKLSLLNLRNILLENNIESVKMEDEPKTGYELLEMIENLTESCNAGFILLTPDDEGRLICKPDQDLQPRARQNVIFESGILSTLFRKEKRLCFIVKKPLELPSDMNGLLYEEFTDEIDSKRIEKILENWGLIN